MTQSPEIRIIGTHPAFLNTLDAVSHLAKIVRPVLIHGERGTGKELIAARLHYLSSRWQAPYVTLNCAAIAETLVESELFGVEPGAFTGANRARAGRLERAHGGTLFLDEIASMPMMMQEKLLRFIEYGEVERLGGHRTLRLDVRIVAASNIDLEHLAAEGHFCSDLLDRLAFEVLIIPPLRARAEDILLLAEHFAYRFCQETSRSLFAGFTSELKRALLRHHWPGNVRELKNLIERSLYRQEDHEAPLAELIFDPFASPYRPARTLQAAKVESVPLETVAHDSADLRSAVAAFERQRIMHALELNHYRIREAADCLGLNYHQLRHLMKKRRIASGKA